ncbi:alpha/beta hydrolase [Cellulomonas cellasea]|uniref:alpha/beta fold hydrolase n=1 Tax=Cellulomonas cellasea TaxID=43670 RepID=UPI0025A3559C|nr:alpha/beta hydrolase [Cellulomonas cellasea]MDM8084460.1 alpha/beta hydrolase [Cellulomonas cellasea]
MHTVTRGEGRPILLIHGFGVDHRLLTSLDGAIAAAGPWRRVYVDLPGMGQSTDPVSSSDDVLDALTELAAAQIGEPFAVVGSSYGGLMARALAARLPDQVRGLALLAPLATDGDGAPDAPPRHVVQADPALLAQLDPADAAEFAEMAVRQTPEAWALFRDHALPGIRAADQAALARLRARYALSRRPEAEGYSYPGPTLVVTARHDQVVGYRDALALLPHYPRSTFALLDDAGHNVHLDQPALVAALLQEWLARVALAAPAATAPARAGAR